jgi:hypothetical protein
MRARWNPHTSFVFATQKLNSTLEAISLCDVCDDLAWAFTLGWLSGRPTARAVQIYSRIGDGDHIPMLP